MTRSGLIALIVALVVAAEIWASGQAGWQMWPWSPAFWDWALWPWSLLWSPH